MRAGSSQANPVRVLHVFGGLGVGGAEVRTMDIYHAIDKTKVQFDFISHKPNEDYFENEIRALGGRIYHVPRYRLHNRAAYQRAWSEFLDAHPYYDTVHIHTTNTAAAILPILARHGVRQRITHAHSSSNPSAAKHILLRMNRNTINRLATVRLAVSADAAAYVYGRAAAGPGGVAIVQDAIDAKKYVFNPDTRAAVRESLSLRDSFV
ncbi:MAG: glycosyltransferase, partial [Clostridiales Family XIII bacterium]|nr:glycosyltransferase [Clostridiales Family XIII bacterium]